MSASDQILKLSGRPVIAQGRRQHVYDHPFDAASLIKLPKPGTEAPRRRWRRRRGDEGIRDFLREFREYVELRTRQPKAGIPLPICAVRGVVETDLGIGLVYERIGEPDGSLSPTLRRLIRSGAVGPRQIDEIERFFEDLVARHVVVSNMNLENIVYQTAADGSARYVWIDSFGSKEFIPFRRWFRALNGRKINKIRRKCLERMTAAGTAAKPGVAAGRRPA